MLSIPYIYSIFDNLNNLVPCKKSYLELYNEDEHECNNFDFLNTYYRGCYVHSVYSAKMFNILHNITIKKIQHRRTHYNANPIIFYLDNYKLSKTPDANYQKTILVDRLNILGVFRLSNLVNDSTSLEDIDLSYDYPNEDDEAVNIYSVTTSYHLDFFKEIFIFNTYIYKYIPKFFNDMFLGYSKPIKLSNDQFSNTLSLASKLDSVSSKYNINDVWLNLHLLKKSKNKNVSLDLSTLPPTYFLYIWGYVYSHSLTTLTELCVNMYKTNPSLLKYSLVFTYYQYITLSFCDYIKDILQPNDKYIAHILYLLVSVLSNNISQEVLEIHYLPLSELHKKTFISSISVMNKDILSSPIYDILFPYVFDSITENGSDKVSVFYDVTLLSCTYIKYLPNELSPFSDYNTSSESTFTFETLRTPLEYLEIHTNSAELVDYFTFAQSTDQIIRTKIQYNYFNNLQI